MNAVTRPATQDEMKQAAEIVIPQAELERLWGTAQGERAREDSKRKWANIGRLSLMLALGGAVIAEGIALAALAPLVRVEPVFVYLRDDGTALASKTWSDLPETIREANLLNVLAEYVRLREGWSSGEGHAHGTWFRLSPASRSANNSKLGSEKKIRKARSGFMATAPASAWW